MASMAIAVLKVKQVGLSCRVEIVLQGDMTINDYVAPSIEA